MKSFRCFQFGHTARQYKTKIDRSGTCRKCGQEGHIAGNCEREALCMFCKVGDPKSANYIAGSGNVCVHNF